MLIMLTNGRKHRYIQWRKHTQKHYSEAEFSECTLQFSSQSYVPLSPCYDNERASARARTHARARTRTHTHTSLVTQENLVVRRRYQTFKIYTFEHIYFYDRHLAWNYIIDHTWGVQKNVRRNPKLPRAHLEFI